MVSSGIVDVASLLDAEGVAVQRFVSVAASPEQRGAVLGFCRCYFGGGVWAALGRPRVRLKGWNGATGRACQQVAVWVARSGKVGRVRCRSDSKQPLTGLSEGWRGTGVGGWVDERAVAVRRLYWACGCWVVGVEMEGE